MACYAAWLGIMRRVDAFIERGKLADIIVLRGNPVEDIGAVKNVSMVIQNGRPVVKEGMLIPSRSYKFYPIQ